MWRKLAISCFVLGFCCQACGKVHSAEPSNTRAVQHPGSSSNEPLQQFDVVIAGGSTAAFSAAIASAESGAKTALLEPTDWVGGQLTSSGVPAIDEAWHTIRDPNTKEPLLDVSRAARDPANMSPSFLAMLQSVEGCGDCWVSRFCFRPDIFLEKQLLPMQRRVQSQLTVFLNTVVKRVELNANGKRIKSLTAIQRTATPAALRNGYDTLPSRDLPDWYSPQSSERFDKQTLTFAAVDQPGHQTVFIDATEWGELLVLSGAPYLQGIEDRDGGTTGSDTCGQATVFCFAERFLAEPVDEPARNVTANNLGFGQLKEAPDAWQKIWTYRRLSGRGAPAPGDVCLQNWGYSLDRREGGNDYPFGYLFKSREAVAKERDDWMGGVDLRVMEDSEQRALDWHCWFKSHAPPGIDPRQIVLDTEVLGTNHGLAKLPYIRDTRRSIGLDGFLLTFADLTGPASQRTGTQFDDRIAIGAYPADVHGLADCILPDYLTKPHDTLPFFVPFRALTNDRFENLIVAGKTMAQSFLTNSATRLHPTEWSTGAAAGVAAAYMARTAKTSRAAYESIREIQPLIRKHTPLEWTSEGHVYPADAANVDSR